MTDKEKIGKVLRDIRISRTGYTIEEVASKFGKSKVWLSQIETRSRNIYFEDAKKLCKIYNCTLTEISEMIDKL